MAITKPQDIIGTKVQIPVFHRGSLAHDSSHVVKQAAALKQPFLYIRRVLGHLVLCSQVNQGSAGDWFFHAELTLYAEPETLNPTAYPLPTDLITRPAHYNDTTVTALQVIDAWDLNFRLGNTLKYIARHQKKASPIADLEKALEYLKLEIERLKAA